MVFELHLRLPPTSVLNAKRMTEENGLSIPSMIFQNLSYIVGSYSQQWFSLQASFSRSFLLVSIKIIRPHKKRSLPDF